MESCGQFIRSGRSDAFDPADHDLIDNIIPFGRRRTIIEEGFRRDERVGKEHAHECTMLSRHPSDHDIL